MAANLALAILAAGSALVSAVGATPFLDCPVYLKAAPEQTSLPPVSDSMPLRGILVRFRVVVSRHSSSSFFVFKNDRSSQSRV